MKEVLCYECGNTITSRDELYTYLSVSGIHGLCSECYMRNQKTLKGVRTPINSQSTIAIMIIAFIVSAFFFLRDGSLVWIGVALFAPIICLLSWLLIERKIKA